MTLPAADGSLDWQAIYRIPLPPLPAGWAESLDVYDPPERRLEVDLGGGVFFTVTGVVNAAWYHDECCDADGFMDEDVDAGECTGFADVYARTSVRIEDRAALHNVIEEDSEFDIKSYGDAESTIRSGLEQLAHSTTEGEIGHADVKGDVAVQYQVHRTLLGSDEATVTALRARIATEGWGRAYLARRDATTGLWGGGLYSPKWVSTHYTLLDLMLLGIDPRQPEAAASAELLVSRLWRGPRVRSRAFDVCVAGMLVSIAAYFGVGGNHRVEMLAYLRDTQLDDGGWNCRWDLGDRHSSLHTTLTVLEAIRDAGAGAPGPDADAAARGCEFLLRKRLFRSSRTGEVIDARMLRLSFPPRWRYDILRALDYLAAVRAPHDARMDDALAALRSKRRASGRWPVQERHAGRVHLDMERTGGESRWNTLRALRVLRAYDSGEGG